jgi:outer membrane protein TolC
MSLFDLLSYAQTNHPLLAVREQEVGLARAEVVGAGLRDNPQFVLDTDTPVNEAGDTQLGMRLTFPFYTANKRELAKIAAVAGVHRACMARGIDEMEIMLDAVDAASEVLYLTNLLEVQKELREFAAKRAEAYTEDLVPTREGGFRLTGRLDVEMSALDLESREYKTRRELIVAQSTLAQVIGAPADVPISVSDPMEIEWGDLLPLEQVKALAAERSPMIAEVNAAINETHKLHILAHAEKVPDIELGPRYQDELGVNGTDSAGLRFNMDLPTSDRNQGDIAATAAQLQVDGANLALARYTAVNQAVVVYQELDRIRQDMRELERRKEILQQRFEEFFSAEQIRRALPEGEALGLAQDLLKQKVNEVELRYQFFRQSRRLEVMIGQPVVMSSAQ